MGKDELPANQSSAWAIAWLLHGAPCTALASWELIFSLNLGGQKWHFWNPHEKLCHFDQKLAKVMSFYNHIVSMQSAL